MGNKRDEKREDLKARLVAAAETLIAEQGLSGLKARDVTERAGCALGGLYTVFPDLDHLVMEVNVRTLARMGEALALRLPADRDPGTALKELAAVYVDFALDNLALWKALFNHRLPEGTPMPDWYRDAHEVLIREIAAPLAALRPDLAPDLLVTRAKTLFAAVHGVVHLSLQARFVGAPRDQIKPEVLALVELMVRGSRPDA
ncbi:TetR/AcrR family transcriptional regulator [Frigidibacter sp. RF13]|uniref:TetR/AcrR family transcriptional regulator n=1 Tax=Frigidibacter sp. RF13 TaxID=2997340 RepID=UPI00226E007E|nr:TetR/AcrR family transcriptional regulator [Frigidibacter sp. RF13]MCY1126872.1 TetR/AcrR family transcriptional regulator [Frigidibacter sp. RF13]